MIYTPAEYAEAFTFGGRKVSTWTIKRRCRNNQLPKGHRAYKKSGGWLIEIQNISDNIMANYNINLTLKKS